MSDKANINIIEAVSLSADRPIESQGKRQRTFSLILFAVFVAVDLLAMMVATSAYGSIVSLQQANDRSIMTLGPLVSSIRANDATGGVASGVGPEGRSLVLVQKGAEDTYETRIYLYQGNIVQEFALAGAPYTPQRATVLAASSTFEFSYSQGLLSVSTDAGTAQVALRYLQQGGAA